MSKTRTLFYLLFKLTLCLCILSFNGSDPEAGKALSLKRQAELQALKSMQLNKLNWSDLMPKDYLPEIENFGYNWESKNQLLHKAQKTIPVVTELSGKEISLVGYVVPLSHDDKAIYEFLLVPFFGACIHVPPPPANQMVYVLPKYPLLIKESWDPIVINGLVLAETIASEYGKIGYVMNEAILTAYDKNDMPARQENH